MAALAGEGLTEFANFLPISTVDPNYREAHWSPPIFTAMAEIVSHGNAPTHSVNVRGTLTDTDVEPSVAELDQYTNVAGSAATQVDITATVRGIASAIGLQAMQFPDPSGRSAEDEIRMQHSEALRRYLDEVILDQIASFPNSTTLGVTLGRSTFIDLKLSLKGQYPTGGIFNAIMNTSDFGNFVKDVASIANPLAGESIGMREMKPNGFEGSYEGVNIFTSSELDQAGASTWQGAIVVGTAYDGQIYNAGVAEGQGVARPSGLISAPVRLTVKTFLGERLGDLVSDQRAGQQLLSYSYVGVAIVDNAQARRWVSLKTA